MATELPLSDTARNKKLRGGVAVRRANAGSPARSQSGSTWSPGSGAIRKRAPQRVSSVSAGRSARADSVSS